MMSAENLGLSPGEEHAPLHLLWNFSRGFVGHPPVAPYHARTARQVNSKIIIYRICTRTPPALFRRHNLLKASSGPLRSSLSSASAAQASAKPIAISSLSLDICFFYFHRFAVNRIEPKALQLELHAHLISGRAKFLNRHVPSDSGSRL